MYKNLVVYELFSPKGQNDFYKKRKRIYIYIYILGHSSLFYLFPIEKLVVEHVKQESITSHVYLFE